MLAILLSFVAVYFQTRPATDQKTFGYQRAGVLAAFVNALTLIVLAAWIGLSAIHRLYAPVAVQPRIMMVVAAAGVLMNGAIATLLWKFSGDINIRSVFLHMLGDTLSTAAVIAGGIGILATGAMWIDPVLSLAHRRHDRLESVTIVRETLNILLEGTPAAVSLAEVRIALSTVPGVLDVHDLHVWSLGSASHALASHVTIPEMPVSECSSILDAINCALRDALPHHPHHHPVRDPRLRDHPRLLRPAIRSKPWAANITTTPTDPTFRNYPAPILLFASFIRPTAGTCSPAPASPQRGIFA